jgi:hypothetical protein
MSGLRLGQLYRVRLHYEVFTYHIKWSWAIRLSNAREVFIISYAGAGYPLVEFLNTRGSWHTSIPSPVLIALY